MSNVSPAYCLASGFGGSERADESVLRIELAVIGHGRGRPKVKFGIYRTRPNKYYRILTRKPSPKVV